MKTIFQITKLFIVCAALLVTAAANATWPRVVSVNNVEELYTAVNDPANADTKVVLSPGIYLLSVNDPDGIPRPNLGRLELQEDMSLTGSPFDRAAVVIDAVNLPATSFPAGPVPLGAIRVGRGRNSIEWLTVKNSAGLSNIISCLPYSGTPHVRIAHVVSTGSAYGVVMQNFGPAFSGKTLKADMIDNDFHTSTRGIRGGFRIGNFQGATGSIVNIRLIGNRVYGNQLSLIVNNGGIDTTVNAFAVGNRFFDNGNGLSILGGLNANGNTINFASLGDEFADNNGTSVFDRGGLVIVGGENTTVNQNTANNNTVNVSLFGSRFSNNQLWDLAAFGARFFNAAAVGSPGTNNHVTVAIRGTGRRNPLNDFYADVSPADPGTTNSVTVIR